jgi:hypothetical protein
MPRIKDIIAFQVSITRDLVALTAPTTSGCAASAIRPDHTAYQARQQYGPALWPLISRSPIGLLPDASIPADFGGFIN